VSQSRKLTSYSRWLTAAALFVILNSAASQPLLAADNVGLAKQALKSLYPELKGRGLHLTIDDGSRLDFAEIGGDFVIDVFEPPPHINISVRQCPPTLVSTRFMFASGDWRLFGYSAAGPVVNTQKRESLNDLVDSHPEWTDSQIGEALTKAGAKFGPNAKDQLVRALPIAALEALAGKIEVISVQFTLRDKEQMKEHLPAASLMWAVEFMSHVDGQPDRKYFALFEPFEGKLTSIGKIPPLP
jgi:hypothetical protein